MITHIESSGELAAFLNTPTTPAEQHDTPLDWARDNVRIGTLHQTYALDAAACTDTLCVLANGSAAAKLVNGTWVPASQDDWSDSGCGVIRDWRWVTVHDAGSFNETTVYATVEQAQAAFADEVTHMREYLETLSNEEV